MASQDLVVPMHKTLGRLSLELKTGDITKQPDMDAVVNAANAELMPGGGVAGAIHRVAGPELAEACRPLALIQPGEAVVTDAFGLPNKKVIHCLGPVYGQDEPSDVLLADCYRNALRLAEQEGLESVAFPAVSTGVFGYPLQETAEVCLQAVVETAPGLQKVRRVRFVLFDDAALDVFARVFKASG